LCREIVHERGYFLQKYNPDGSVGSGWHSYWDKNGKKPMVPIQEDETALVLWAMWEHHAKYGDTGTFEELYEGLVEKCADFMVSFRDEVTNLPLPSWNLWEDRRGVHTFTCATVVAGLRAAANFARLYGRHERSECYTTAASEIVNGMRKHLYSDTDGRFLRALTIEGESLVADATIDASLFGIFHFKCFDVDDEVVVRTMKAVEDRLINRSALGGVMRFEGDGYMRNGDAAPPNSWIITTLWLAEYYIASSRTQDDLAKALAILEWTANRASASGILAEQIDPETGRPLSVSPLTWSHSTFVATVDNYLSRFSALSQ